MKIDHKCNKTVKYTIQTVYTRKSAVLNLSWTEISTAVLFRNS